MLGREVEVPADAVVIRFRPTDPNAVLSHVQAAARFYGRHQASVFAARAVEGETKQDVIARLLAAAELSGVEPANNKKVFICGSAQGLLDAGFRFYKDEDDDELDCHYSVDLGDDPSPADVVRFLAAFTESDTWAASS